MSDPNLSMNIESVKCLNYFTLSGKIQITAVASVFEGNIIHPSHIIEKRNQFIIPTVHRNSEKMLTYRGWNKQRNDD